MAKTKRQHYVPRCYLDQFTTKGGKIWAFDKFTHKVCETSPANVALEGYFYDMPEATRPLLEKHGIDVQFMEKALAQKEGQFNSDLDAILKTVERRGISHLQRTMLAPYIIIQMLRTREAREDTLQMKVKITRSVADEFLRRAHPEISPDAYRIEYNKDRLVLDHINQLLDEDFIVEMAAYLLDHIWIVYVNETIQPFYTSDHPVVKKSHVKHPGRSFSGIRSPGIEIAFPLSSRYTLAMFERSHFKPLENLEGKARPVNAFGVEHFNILQVTRSYRQVYCGADEFEQAKGACRRWPDICSPDRNRTEVTVQENLLSCLGVD